MKIKNNKGVTLISLSIYVVAMLAVIAVIATFKSNIDEQIDSMGEYTSVVPEINKMNMYMLGEANIENNKVLRKNAEGTYIAFSSGNDYMFNNNNIYKNSIKILSDVKNCTFEIGKENNNDVLYVNFEVGNEESVSKKLKYVIK